jgi:hypothetical protein
MVAFVSTIDCCALALAHITSASTRRHATPSLVLRDSDVLSNLCDGHLGLGLKWGVIVWLVGIALRRSADAPYMRRWKYLLRRQKLSTKNDETQRVAQKQLRIFSYHGLRESCRRARRYPLGKPCFRERNDETADDCNEEGPGSPSPRFLNSSRSSARFVSIGRASWRVAVGSRILASCRGSKARGLGRRGHYRVVLAHQFRY